MKIKLTSVFVNDQNKALDFYTKLGATRLDEWLMHRLDGNALADVARTD